MSISAQQASEVLANADCLFDETQVNQAYDRMAADITASMGDTDPLVLCVMTGGVIAAGHLLTRLRFPLQIDYIHATRYGGNTTGGELKWIASPRASLECRSVLLIDDIHDVGATLDAIIAYCLSAGAQSVYSAVLVNKLHDRKAGRPADFVGIDVEDRYLFGCGMDYKGYHRNLPAIYAVGN